jgi:hypothetical protein
MGAPILLVGEFPGYYEFKYGHSWAGPAGKVLETELRLVGINIWGCRSTNLWLHEKSKTCNLEWHKNKLSEELAGRSAVLLMGSDVASLFGVDISKTNGLPINDPFIGNAKAMLAYNPALVRVEGSVLGEFRLAIERFKEMLKDV